MNRVLPMMLCAALLCTGAVAVRAEGIPWKAGDKPKDAAAPAGDLKAELPAAQYNRIVKPIEAKLASAEKIMAAHEKEMQKPAEKRNQRLLVGCKTRAAEAYLGAALAAKKGLNMVKKDSHKQAIKEQYEEPNRKKGIDIFLDLATSAHDRGDFRMAIAFYKRILAVDKENDDAKEGLVKIVKEMQEAARAGKTSGSKGGGSDDQKSWDRDDPSRTGRTDGNWSGAGRGY